jgi:hypothetical protein
MKKPRHPGSPPAADPSVVTAEDRAQFRRTLAKVMAVQIVALAVLWWMQTNFTH